MEQSFEAVKANLFPASHAAISDWKKFPWHRDSHRVIQTYKPNSSQALAIDVFGTIKVSKERDRVLGALARECELPDDGPWTLKLEWNDPKNLLGEPSPTQVDAIAFGPRSLLVIECKFSEPGGGCSQPNPISKGAHKGLRQCNGDYVLQQNPVNERIGRCALTGKGVRYWETITHVLGISADQDCRPCPFKGEAFQWMRNVVLAHRLADDRGLKGAVIAAFADAAHFDTAKKVRSGTVARIAGSSASLITPLSYQRIIALAKSLAETPDEWNDLATWVERKIAFVAGHAGKG